MTIEQMHERFDILQDKYESPYFTESEKDHFINLAQDVVFKKLMDAEIPQLGITKTFESNEIRMNAIRPFVVSDLAVSATAGLITNSDINTALDARVSGAELHRVANIRAGGNHIRFVRHNDIGRIKRNKYLSGTEQYPIYTMDEQGFKIEPNTITSCTVSVLRKHNDVSFSGSTDSEFPEFVHPTILFDALLLAGVPIKDSDIAVLRQYDRDI